MEYSPRVVNGFALMYELHRTQLRKGSGIPYLTHLLEVAAIVGRYGGGEDQFIAALLHDAVEDQGGKATLERIRSQFGDTVARYVSGCTDADTSPKPPWEDRKRLFIAATQEVEPAIRLIIAADKLHNARCITHDLRLQGNSFWTIFKKGRDSTLWYYGEMLRALTTNWEHPILHELTEQMQAMFLLANHLA